MIYFAQKTALHHYKQVSLWSGWIWSMLFSHPQKWSEFWHFKKLWILALVCTHMEIFGFEVNHEYIIQYVEAVEHNSWTFEVHFDTFSVFQTVWGILYYLQYWRTFIHLRLKASDFWMTFDINSFPKVNRVR